MGEVNYKPLIDDMVWSFSRVSSYTNCPYRWYLRYICRCQGRSKFYASYGKLMHKIIEQYYNGEIKKEDMVLEFITNFPRQVTGLRPNTSTLMKFIDGAVNYLDTFEPFPYQMLGVEEEIEFTIDGLPFIGYIDYRGMDEDGEFVLIDNKSRDLKPRSGREPPTLRDKELDEIFRQLYVYSVGIKQKYGKYPKTLGINCFRTGTFITEPFDEAKCEEAKAWIKSVIAEIREDENFDPHPDYFSCFWICGMDDICEYHD